MSGTGPCSPFLQAWSMCQGHSNFLVSFPDPNNPSAERFQWDGGSGDLTRVTRIFGMLTKSFARDVISVEFYKKI